MINVRAQEPGIRTKLCNHSCRAGSIALYRQMGERWSARKNAQAMLTRGLRYFTIIPK